MERQVAKDNMTLSHGISNSADQRLCGSVHAHVRVSDFLLLNLKGFEICICLQARTERFKAMVFNLQV